MARMPGVLRPRPKFSEAELAIAQERTEARLADLFGHGSDPAGHPGRPGARRPRILVEGASDLIGLPPEPGTEILDGLPGESVTGELVGVMESPSDTPELVSVVVTVTSDSELVGVMERPLTAAPFAVDARAAVVIADDRDSESPPIAEDPIDPVGARVSPPGEAARPSRSAGPRRVRHAPTEARPQEERPPTAPAPKRAAPRGAAAKGTTMKGAAAKGDLATPALRRASTALRTARARPRRAAAQPAPVVPAVLCPSCAMLLQPPPSASRRCPRCRQRIIVKRVEGRTAYLTEAAVATLEAERRKAFDSARHSRERERWLKLALAAGAPAQRTGRLAAAHASQDAVEAARQLYMATANRAFQAAKHDHLWEDASRIRRDQATALHRLGGLPLPPPDDLLALYREGVAVQLRGLAEFVREAELVSAMCCDACRIDSGRISAISKELRGRRLPHQGCPKVFCRCTWDLATRDRDVVLRYLRRRPRAVSRPVARKGDS